MKGLNLANGGKNIRKRRVANKTSIVRTKEEEFYSDTEDPMIESISIFDKNHTKIPSPSLHFGEDEKIETHPKSNEFIIKKEKNRFFLKQLINEIEVAQKNANKKVFTCRFCLKTFDKPSSLGGHTAKKHYGLSKKYKVRLDAARRRKTERDRNNFMKKKIYQQTTGSDK